MPISTKQLVDNINFRLVDDTTSTNTSSVYLAQLSEAAREIKQGVVSVKSEEFLPVASDNIGRLIYVESLCDYKYSNGSEWIRDYNTELTSGNFIYGWGKSLYIGLNYDTTSNFSSPVSIAGGFTDWCYVAAGRFQGIGIRSNGTLWTWGCASCGTLGVNDLAVRSSPVKIAGGISNWCQASATDRRGSSITTTGELWSWGYNGFGSLGDNTTVNRSSPVSVVGGFNDWCQIGVAGSISASIRTNGTIWTWGCNGSGAVGDGTTVNKSSPVSIVGGFTDWCQVSVGLGNVSAVKNDGSIWSWGCNSQGRLGDGTTTNRSSPVSIVGGFTDWCQVSTGYTSVAAIRASGTLWSWGRNNYGQVGDNTVIDRSSPVCVIGGFTNWCQVSGSNGNMLALQSNGTAWAWGRGDLGKLGTDSATSRSSPTSVVGQISSWCQISAGYRHSLAIAAQPIKGFTTP